MKKELWYKLLRENKLNENVNIVSQIEFYEDDFDEGNDKITIKPHTRSDIEVKVKKQYTQRETKQLEKELNALLEKTISTFIKKIK